MLGLVDYGSDSDSDGQQQGAPQQEQQHQGTPQQAVSAGRQQAAPQAAGGRVAAAAAAAALNRPSVGATSGLPSAAALFGDDSAPSRLPAPYFGPPTTAVGGKRTHPDTRGPKLAGDTKLQRSGGAPNVGAAKPAALSGLLLPPQLRGRANVSTEDLSMFSKESQRAAQRGSGGGGRKSTGGGSLLP